MMKPMATTIATAAFEVEPRIVVSSPTTEENHRLLEEAGGGPIGADRECTSSTTSSSEVRRKSTGALRQQQPRPSLAFQKFRRPMHRQNIRALALIVCFFTYLMIGAAIFDALESEKDQEVRELVDMVTGNMQAKYNFTAQDFKVLEHIVVKSIPHKAGFQWKFAGAFYFATVVITTVGYGHSTPTTPQGKAFCILYALAGIPLNLVMFQSIGERLNTLICYVLTKAKRCLRSKNREVSMTHLTMVSSTLGTLVILIGTYVFNKYENWGYFDSYYYCFITLTTIGFGDFVAMQKNGDLQNKPGYVAFSLLFMLFGMAMFSAAVNLFVLRFLSPSSDKDSMEAEASKAVMIRGMHSNSNETLNSAGKASDASRLSNLAPKSRPYYSDIRLSMLNERSIITKTPNDLGDDVSACPCCPRSFGRPRPRYTVRRQPGQITHLLNTNLINPGSDANTEASPVETDQFLLQNELRRRRPSL